MMIKKRLIQLLAVALPLVAIYQTANIIFSEKINNQEVNAFFLSDNYKEKNLIINDVFKKIDNFNENKNNLLVKDNNFDYYGTLIKKYQTFFGYEYDIKCVDNCKFVIDLEENKNFAQTSYDIQRYKDSELVIQFNLNTLSKDLFDSLLMFDNSQVINYNQLPNNIKSIVKDDEKQTIDIVYNKSNNNINLKFNNIPLSVESNLFNITHYIVAEVWFLGFIGFLFSLLSYLMYYVYINSQSSKIKNLNQKIINLNDDKEINLNISKIISTHNSYFRNKQIELDFSSLLKLKYSTFNLIRDNFYKLSNLINKENKVIIINELINYYIKNYNFIDEKEDFINYINQFYNGYSKKEIIEINQSFIENKFIIEQVGLLNPLFIDLIKNNIIIDSHSIFIILSTINVNKKNNNDVLNYVNNLLGYININDIKDFLNIVHNKTIYYKNDFILGLIDNYYKNNNIILSSNNDIGIKINKLLLENINNDKWANIKENFNFLYNEIEKFDIDKDDVLNIIYNYLVVIVDVNNKLKGQFNKNIEINKLFNSNIESCNLYLIEKINDLSNEIIKSLKINEKTLNLKN